MILSLLRCSLVFFADPPHLLLLLLLLLLFRSPERHVVVPTSNCRVSSAQLQAPLYSAGPGLAAWPPSIDQSQVTPFILLKSICAEGLTRRHETECRHATRRHIRLVENARTAGLFILLKSICAEGLTRRHETECRHATRVRSSRFYMLLILRHISHNIYRISYRNISYHNTVQYSTVQYSTVQYSMM